VVLKVDDKKRLPKNQGYISGFSGDSVTTYGQRAADLEYRFRKNSQPWFVKLDDGFNILDSLDYISFDERAETFFK
jgi:thiol:disulfide interchange protein DsbD